MADDTEKKAANIAPRDQVYRTLRGLNATPTATFETPGFHRLHGSVEGGTRVITYATQASAQGVPLLYDAKTLHSLFDAEHDDAVKPALAEIEKVCNVRFRRLPASESHNANIIIFTTPDTLKREVTDYSKPQVNGAYQTKTQEFSGYASGGGERRNIVVMRNRLKETILHELGHTLGLGDIEGGVDRNGSVMARKGASMSRAYDFLGPYDIDALQRDEYYGPPKNRNPDADFSVNGKYVTLYSETPITLRMRRMEQSYDVALPPRNTGDAPIRDVLSFRLAFNTDINNADLSGSTAPQRITGNELANILTGGNAENSLTSIGTGDTLTGNKNLAKDTFILTPGSHLTTLINLDHPRDEIQLPEATAKVALHHNTTVTPARTEATAFDGTGKALASFFADLPPEQTMLALAEKLRTNTSIVSTSKAELGALTPLAAQPALPLLPLKQER